MSTFIFQWPSSVRLFRQNNQQNIKSIVVYINNSFQTPSFNCQINDSQIFQDLIYKQQISSNHNCRIGFFLQQNPNEFNLGILLPAKYLASENQHGNNSNNKSQNFLRSKRSCTSNYFVKNKFILFCNGDRRCTDLNLKLRSYSTNIDKNYSKEVLDNVAIYFSATIQKKHSIAGIAAVIKDDKSDEILAHEYKFIDQDISFNEAQFQAALLGLLLARQINPPKITMIGDSDLVLGALTGLKKISKPNLASILQEIEAVTKNFEIKEFKNVKQLGEENNLAKSFSTFAVNSKQSENVIFWDKLHKKQTNQTQEFGQEDFFNQLEFEQNLLEEPITNSRQNKSELGSNEVQQIQPLLIQKNKDKYSSKFEKKLVDGDPQVQAEIKWLESKMPVFENLLNCRRNNINQKVVIIQFDGGARGNPGVAGCGAVLIDAQTGKQLFWGCWYIGDNATNNTAEFKSLILGLLMAKCIGAKNIKIQGDSNLLIQALNKKYKIGKEHLKNLFKEIEKLLKWFEVQEYEHIKREYNAVADKLSNQAMDCMAQDPQFPLQLPETEIIKLLR